MEDQAIINVMDGIILNSSNQNQVMPGWVANGTYKELDPDSVAPLRVRYSALQYLKQMARQRLRGKFEPNDDRDALQHELFPTIQARYPVMRDDNEGEAIYIKPEFMSPADWTWNIHRLRTEATTKLRHADALEQWGIERGLDKQAVAA